jgi:hypothetical protein
MMPPKGSVNSIVLFGSGISRRFRYSRGLLQLSCIRFPNRIRSHLSRRLIFYP